MDQYMEILNQYLAGQKAAGEEPEAESLLDMLYYQFCIYHDLDTEEISQTFQEMDDILIKLSLDDNNQLFCMTCDLCEKYQREAFHTGLLVGFRLCQELADKHKAL